MPAEKRVLAVCLGYSNLRNLAYLLPFSDTVSHSMVSPTTSPRSSAMSSGIVALTELDVVVAFDTFEVLPTTVNVLMPLAYMPTYIKLPMLPKV